MVRIYICFSEFSGMAGKFICSSAEDVEKPKFISEPFDIETFDGTTIELPCAGKGNPKPEVS